MVNPSRVCRAIAKICGVSIWACGAWVCWPDATALAQDGPQIYLKLDFETDQNPFAPTDSSEAATVGDPEQVLSGRSLHVRRARGGSYIGATVPLKIIGAADLRIAFAVRARGMQTVAVNVFDQRRQDNTTPRSPARVFDDDWHPVVFAVEDFRYNGGPVDQTIELETNFANLLLHGQENGAAAEFWVDKLVIYRGHDDQPPDAPVAVRGAAAVDGSVDLNWQEPPDNTFAVVYSVYRRTGTLTWEKIAESLKPMYRDRAAPPGTHTYRITAADFENNVSPPSSEVTVVTTASVPGRNTSAPTTWVADRVNYAENVRQIRARGAGKVRPDVFLFAGDSITAATVYTHILGSWLARGVTVRQGVGTVTTEFGATNIKRYLAGARPEFAVIMYGTNDQERGASPSESMRNLAAVVDACVEVGTIPVLATIPPRGFNKSNQRGQERFNQALTDLARQKRVPVSYVFEELMRHDLKAMLFDGIHLEPEGGNNAAGRALRQTMDQVYFALRDTSGQW